MTGARRVLFICSGNTCRSQMAEAMVNAGWEGWHAYSAGVRPEKNIAPFTLRVLREIGIEHDGQPKGIETFRGQKFDLVVTVCDTAREACPVWPGSGLQRHEDFRDPAEATGSEAERLEVYRHVRDDIAAALPRLLS